MDCIECELRRSRLRAACLSFVGMSLEVIADDLSKRYGASYYVTYSVEGTIRREILYRASKIAPYESYEITRTVINEQPRSDKPRKGIS